MLRFLVFSDLHYDEVEDGDRRVEEILESAQKKRFGLYSIVRRLMQAC